jgi:hypothetical protein
MSTVIRQHDAAVVQSPTGVEPTDFDIASIVAQLRTLREESLATRQRVGMPVKLPSRSALPFRLIVLGSMQCSAAA